MEVNTSDYESRAVFPKHLKERFLEYLKESYAEIFAKKEYWITVQNNNDLICYFGLKGQKT